MNNLEQIARLVKKDKVLQGSFFEDLFDIMASREFIDGGSDIDEEGEFLGEMNDLEKTLWTLVAKYQEIIEDDVNYSETNPSVDSEIDRAFTENLFNSSYELLKESVGRRFQKKIRPGFNFISFCPGFRLVANKIPDEDEFRDNGHLVVFYITTTANYDLKYPIGSLPGVLNARVSDSRNKDNFSFVDIKAEENWGEDKGMGYTEPNYSTYLDADFEETISITDLSERIKNDSEKGKVLLLKLF